MWGPCTHGSLGPSACDLSLIGNMQPEQKERNLGPSSRATCCHQDRKLLTSMSPVPHCRQGHSVTFQLRVWLQRSNDKILKQTLGGYSEGGNSLFTPEHSLS